MKFVFDKQTFRKNLKTVKNVYFVFFLTKKYLKLIIIR